MKFYIFSSLEPKPDWKSWFIMKATHAKYSHVGIIVDNTIYHSIGEGVKSEPVDKFLEHHEFAHKIDVTDYILNDGKEAIGWLKGNLDKDYSETQFLGFVLKKLPWLQRFFADGASELICTEYVARFCNEYTSIQSFKSLSTEFFEPDEFIELLLSGLSVSPV